MKIGDSIKRKGKSSDKWSDVKIIKNQKELEYHQDLKEKGFEYIVIHMEKKPGCESCEG